MQPCILYTISGIQCLQVSLRIEIFSLSLQKRVLAILLNKVMLGIETQGDFIVYTPCGH